MTGAIRIGAKSYYTARPGNLADELASGLGLGVDETRQFLSDRPSASLVARALAPFLDGPRPATADLAREIAAAGTAMVAAAVAAMLIDEGDGE